jgi:hypothetical protein
MVTHHLLQHARLCFCTTHSQHLLALLLLIALLIAQLLVAIAVLQLLLAVVLVVVLVAAVTVGPCQRGTLSSSVTCQLLMVP